jgi:hypothetical protein
MLLIDRALETAYVVAGLTGAEDSGISFSVRDDLRAGDVGISDAALIPAAEIALLAETHRADPVFGLWTSGFGAIAMRSPVRPDEVNDASVLLYGVSGTAELLARATIWPFYGIRVAGWTTEADGSNSLTIVDGISALEPVEAGFSEDLVRAWYILTEQPVVTHLLVVPADTLEADVVRWRTVLNDAFDAGYAARRDVRKVLLSESSADNERLVDFFLEVQHELDETSRAAAYSLIARGAGGTRYPLIREIPWWTYPDTEKSESETVSSE